MTHNIELWKKVDGQTNYRKLPEKFSTADEFLELNPLFKINIFKGFDNLKEIGIRKGHYHKAKITDYKSEKIWVINPKITKKNKDEKIFFRNDFCRNNADENIIKVVPEEIILFEKLIK